MTVGKLREIIKNLHDDFSIDIRVRTRLTKEQLKNLSYPYPYNTEHALLEFDDVGYSDKRLCLGCEVNLFTKEQVEELLKKQREICAKHYAEHYGADDCMSDVLVIENAPSPSLEGEKK